MKWMQRTDRWEKRVRPSTEDVAWDIVCIWPCLKLAYGCTFQLCKPINSPFKFWSSFVSFSPTYNPKVQMFPKNRISTVFFCFIHQKGTNSYSQLAYYAFHTTLIIFRSASLRFCFVLCLSQGSVPNLSSLTSQPKLGFTASHGHSLLILITNSRLCLANLFVGISRGRTGWKPPLSLGLESPMPNHWALALAQHHG